MDNAEKNLGSLWALANRLTGESASIAKRAYTSALMFAEGDKHEAVEAYKQSLKELIEAEITHYEELLPTIDPSHTHVKVDIESRLYGYRNVLTLIDKCEPKQ